MDTIASSDGVRKVCCPDGYSRQAKIDQELAGKHTKLVVTFTVRFGYSEFELLGIAAI
ncbi:hypothetical protein [Pseudomonas syringae group genomosp. 3]|uniref:hypothetical protein n=1 Tax=Pseudomonas syringae group genomosp. 3 TaxID=251701 RepID=UPI00139673DD|nr:hypothetical protein [Pseudomonas syringae group genomosp. 3]